MMNVRLPLAVADACFLIAAFNRRDADHEEASEVLGHVGTIIVPPLVLAEVDHALLRKTHEKCAVDSLHLLSGKAQTGDLLIPPIGEDLLAEAVDLLRSYVGHALGAADAMTACLAWRMSRPAVLSFDRHFTDVIHPRRHGEKYLEVWPDRYGMNDARRAAA